MILQKGWWDKALRSWGQNEVKEWEVVKSGVGRPRELEDIAALEALTEEVEASKERPDE